MKKVTVVIPNYEGIRFVGECLEALVHQKEGTPEYDILVVDNGSRDGSRELIQEGFPGIGLISLSSNTGFCHAVNVGIQAAETPYVILLNNDTRVSSGFVKALYDAIEGDERIFSVSAKMLMWDEPELIDDAGDQYCVLGWAYSRGKGKRHEEYDKPVRIFSACGGAAIYRKSVFGEIGLFDEPHFAYLEDLDIGYRARICGYQNYYEPKAEVIHYGSATSGARYNEWKTSLCAENNVYVIAKNMPLVQKIWNFPFLFIGFLIKFLFFCRKKMGMLYLKGIGKGLKKSFVHGKKYRENSLKWKRFKNHLMIQGSLYANTLGILKKS